MDDSFKSITLMQKVATANTVEKLYAQGLINQEGKDYALEFLAPHQAWGSWVATILWYVGWLLILSGIGYLFALNWAHLSTFHQFAIIEISLFCCLLGTWTYSLVNLTGKILLTVASVLVGIFVLVFNHIYPLFLSLPPLLVITCILTFPWVAISDFKYLWGLWIAGLGMALILWLHSI